MAEQPRSTRRADAFRQVREAHRTEMAEDYVELIGDLIAETGEARLTDLAEQMGVRHATASKIVARLQRDGLVQSRPYRSIFLTEAGEALAVECRQRHKIVYDFLRAIGVEQDIAELDSEGLEHHCSPETLAIFARMTARLNDGDQE